MSLMKTILDSKPKSLSPERRLQIARRSTYGNYRRIIGQLNSLKRNPLLEGNSHLINQIHFLERHLELIDPEFRRHFQFKSVPKKSFFTGEEIKS